MWRMMVLMLFLAACNTPSPHFAGATVTRVSVDGSVFDVRVRGNLAEAIRVKVQYAPRFGPIHDRARAAMAQVSGCRVIEVQGDQALATGVLACEGHRLVGLYPRVSRINPTGNAGQRQDRIAQKSSDPLNILWITPPI